MIILKLLSGVVFLQPIYALAATSLVLTEKGLGPIHAKTKFNQAEVQKLLPKYSVKQNQSSSEGESFEILEIFENKTLLATIYPSGGEKIFSIVVHNNKIKNNLGTKIGTTFEKVYRKAEPNCAAGMEEMSSSIICKAPQSQKVSYVFSKPTTDEPDGVVPSPAAMKKEKIKLISWKP